MRPRGESISSPHSRYVGHVGRQKPQCTQVSISAVGGASCPRSTPDVVAGLQTRLRPHSSEWSSAGVEDAGWIERVFERPRPAADGGRAPHVHLRAHQPGCPRSTTTCPTSGARTQTTRIACATRGVGAGRGAAGRRRVPTRPANVDAAVARAASARRPAPAASGRQPAESHHGAPVAVGVHGSATCSAQARASAPSRSAVVSPVHEAHAPHRAARHAPPGSTRSAASSVQRGLSGVSAARMSKATGSS